MVFVDHIIVEGTEPTDAGSFYRDTLGLGTRVRVQASEAPTSGFRGCLLGLVVARPATVDHLVAKALDAGATSLKPVSKSLWGYGGAVQAPDGTVVTVASSSKKDTGPAESKVDQIVLQLGVDDVAASKRFYTEHGAVVAKSYGRKYVELDTGAITVTLNKRGDLAKTAGVPPEGTGSHRLIISGDAGPFTDPDGYVWAS
ncbi:glyoxalase [Georgenia sp. MJ173]|uniref:glyoxalase n=1 Tax=Georgenia sunbinii TaxID=3117728 RepID=UPI002F26DDCD